jgi:hypothetical protein
MNWCVWADSNGHWMRSQRIPSANWGTDAWFIVGWASAYETQHRTVRSKVLGLAIARADGRKRPYVRSTQPTSYWLLTPDWRTRQDSNLR